MLGLKNKTNPEWIAAANSDLPAILVDHAHCEKKAAANALSLINRYAEKTALVEKMLTLAQEELQHFALIHHIILDRSIPFTFDKGDAYAKKLHEHEAKKDPDRLLDSLLIASLIEARSCERFTILSEECSDPSLKKVYKGLLASEAGHYTIFTDLAREYFPADKVKQRLDEMLTIESKIVSELDNKPTMHG
ncbi:MAG TPA: tRNA-(ms[2]io[6]A)-hydroxylase [Candidatus Kapabacteria bacterium]|nr:tRNA-(ms[2]io[6]A)-hydroxylase [Candidatus Kapabacteria bacterium]